MRKPRESRKGFDCVAFKRRAQERIYEEIKGLSPAEEIAYFRRTARAGALGTWWKAVRRRGSSLRGDRRET